MVIQIFPLLFRTFPTYLGFDFSQLTMFRTFPGRFDECKQLPFTSLNLLGFLRPIAVTHGPGRGRRACKPSSSIPITAYLSNRYEPDRLPELVFSMNRHS